MKQRQVAAIIFFTLITVIGSHNNRTKRDNVGAWKSVEKKISQ